MGRYVHSYSRSFSFSIHVLDFPEFPVSLMEGHLPFLVPSHGVLHVRILWEALQSQISHLLLLAFLVSPLTLR